MTFIVDRSLVKTIEPTVDEQKAHFMGLVQQWLDDIAKAREYDNSLSLVPYAVDPDSPWHEEALHLIKHKSLVWIKAYELYEEVKNGTRPIPATFSDILPDLPQP